MMGFHLRAERKTVMNETIPDAIGVLGAKKRNLMTHKATLVVAVCVVALAAGCNRVKKEDRILFDGFYFPTKASAVDKKATLSQFDVQVKDAGSSIEGAREAGRYAGTRYCIEKYGSSDIIWSVGPDSDPSQLRVVDGALNLRGTCQRP